MPSIDSSAPALGINPAPPRTDTLLRDGAGFDVPAIAEAVQARAVSDPQGARQLLDNARAALGPVEQGQLARALPAQGFLSFDFPGIPGIPGIPGLPGLPKLPSLPFPSLPNIPGIPGLPGLPNIPGIPGLPNIPGVPHIPNPIDIIKETIEKIGDGLEALERGAEAVKEQLQKLPHEIADKVADSMRGDKARKLTPDEKAAIKEAYGNRVDIDKVRIVDGPGNSPIARAAFAKGNPAITIGNTVYIKPGHYSTDFASTAGGRNTLIHEFSHVVQYKELGYGSFATKYAADLARVGGNPDKLYDYESRDTTFATETLEGQAQMVGRYAEIRNSTNPADRAEIADLEKRLKGTGIYGL